MLAWLTHGGQAYAAANGYVPLPAQVRQLAVTMLQQVTGPSGATSCGGCIPGLTRPRRHGRPDRGRNLSAERTLAPDPPFQQPEPSASRNRLPKFDPVSESARGRGKSIGGAAVTDEAMLAAALHLRGQELSLRDIAGRLVIATGKEERPASLTGHRDAHAARA